MKKYLSIIVCVCILFGMSLPASAAPKVVTAYDRECLGLEAAIENVASKNMSTGEVSHFIFEYEKAVTTYSTGVQGEVCEGWFPDVSDRAENASSENSYTYSIIGSDDRQKVSNTKDHPYSAICYIEIEWPDGSTGMGTAWMLNRAVAVTAGHCVYSSANGGWAKSIKLWPGKNGYGFWNNPYGTTTATSINTSSEWVSLADERHDWAILELNDNIGDKTGWFGFAWTPESLTDAEVTISGYPGEHRYYQYKMSGKITGCNTYKLYYNAIDTSGGQSGSPIFNSVSIVYGIHCYGGATENSGTRITEGLFNLLKTYIE